MDGEPLGEGRAVDFNKPVHIDASSAAALAEALREAGYSRCRAAEVTAELAKPGRERSYVGKVATSLLKRAGTVPLTLAGR